jgi:methylated-DNA-protein-cysteine methyltransferase-like protein
MLSHVAKVTFMPAAAFSYAQIHELVSRIPRGRVATYGQIAKLAGISNGARAVGYALSALSDNSAVPWHRVVNAAGEISLRTTGDAMENIQRMRLEREGVAFDARGRIRLSEFQWDAEESFR